MSFSFLAPSQLVYRAYTSRMAESKVVCRSQLSMTRFLCSPPEKQTWKPWVNPDLFCAFSVPTSFVIFSHLWLALFISYLYLEQATTSQIISIIHLFQSPLKMLCLEKKNCEVSSPTTAPRIAFCKWDSALFIVSVLCNRNARTWCHVHSNIFQRWVIQPVRAVALNRF